VEGKSIKVTFKTLTPLWTGDAWGESNELKLTGIIGSLRWWFEALVRGMGYKACDSTGDKCQVEIKNPDDVLNIHKKICSVCYLFGTTGWKSRFSVNVDAENVNLEPVNKFEVRTRTNNHKVRGKYNYLSRYCDGLFGSFTLNFSFFSDIPEGYICLFVKLLKLLNDYGMIGAKISQGNGVCNIEFKNNHSYFDINNCLNKNYSDISLKNTANQKDCVDCPKLSDFRFLKINIGLNNVNINHIWRKDNNDSKSLRGFDGDIDKLWNDKKFLPVSFHIRDLIRNLWRSGRELRHTFMGKRGEGSNIFVSHGYRIGENQIQLRIVGYGLKDEQWQKIEDSLTNTNLNNFLWFNNKNYVSTVSILQKVLGQNLITGGSDS